MQARLPEEKLAALLEELSRFKDLYASHHRCTKRQLLSVIGKQGHTCRPHLLEMAVGHSTLGGRIGEENPNHRGHM